ncbi:MAG: proB [Deltaproteobacteria bacterium]|nr:proB [Deltaproteobacteria bacterium]MBP2689226.1 proB [Deltaproteobacteria bacterium]MBS1244142.1 proB [Deltaproteobacteria bacterium]
MSPEQRAGTPLREMVSSPRVRRVVVKLGSGTVTDPGAGLRMSTIRALAAQMTAALSADGVSFVVVTSGAIAAGREKLGMAERPRTISLKQAAAAVGQTSLMRAYERAFEKRGRHVGQLLLTHEDFESRERYVNARNTLLALLSRGIVPIVNENDTVATEEIRLGDNDHLATLVTQMIGADLLILLTDSDGLQTKDPHRHPDARRIPVVENLDDESVRTAVGRRVSSAGTGGMASKLRAARVLSASGIPVVIASGLSRRSILDILGGKDTGTLILPRRTGKLRSRKMWIAYAMSAHGTIVVDDGARKVLLEGGKSLLPAGVTGVRGRFRPGDAVSIADRRGRVFARGIARWSVEQVDRGKGKRSAEIRTLLGAETPAEVVHRDDLTILPQPGAPESRKGTAQR